MSRNPIESGVRGLRDWIGEQRTPYPRVIAVVGPTAAGKSDLGVFLAQWLGGEVVNADSMQLYRGMDIGTAKLTPEERGGVPHHLLDIWDVTVAASVAEYQRLARERIDALLAEGRWPVLVGGSGLYVRGAVDNLEFPGTDPEVRARLEEELTLRGPGALHARLAVADPEAAKVILPGNGRRIVRALEVIEITGRPFTANLPGHDSVYDTLQIGVDVPRPELDERIARRVDRMWEAGLVEEVRALEARGCARAYGVARTRLPAGARRARRGLHPRGGPERDRPCHQALRAPSGFMVQARSPGALVEWGRGGPDGTSAARVVVGRTTGYSLITSWHRDAQAVIGACDAVPSSSFDRPSEVLVGRARGDGGRPSRHRTRHRTPHHRARCGGAGDDRPSQSGRT
ncbi:hypothetical protein SHKM778_22880 [Streptomyces sp. KM77-8]|uniref:tRNA dimethylallyltransferase n=1 Tax=Streptomyces haneummycinicus TaxID=3074435 RepID=A0AAT9HFF5_9ACTN